MHWNTKQRRMVYSTCTSPVGQITFGVTNIFVAQFPFPYWLIAIYSISSSDCVVYDKNCNLYTLLIFHVLTERVIVCNFPQLRKQQLTNAQAATHKCASSNSQMRKQQLTNAQAGSTVTVVIKTLVISAVLALLAIFWRSSAQQTLHLH